MAMRQRCDLHATCNGICNGCNALQVAAQTVRQPFRYRCARVAPPSRHHVSTASGPCTVRARLMLNLWPLLALALSGVTSKPGTHRAGTQPSTHEISTLDDSKARWPPHHTDCVLPRRTPAPAGRRGVRAGPAGLLQTLPEPFPSPFDTLSRSFSGSLCQSLYATARRPCLFRAWRQPLTVQ